MHPSCLPSFKDLNDCIIRELCKSISATTYRAIPFDKINMKPEQLLQITWDYTNGNINLVESFGYANPNANHQLIAELAVQGMKCIITTNFDRCLEKSLSERNVAYEVYTKVPTTDSEKSRLLKALDQEHKVLLWKPHGDCLDPSTLCYTTTQVAKLSNSIYLKDVLQYIIDRFNMIFLGYSGYDDDIFPALYEIIPNSRKQIIWNSYKSPENDSPCALLKNSSGKNFQVYIGDMAELLKNLTAPYIPKASFDCTILWEKYLKSSIETLSKSKQISILAKYLFDYGLSNLSENLWREGVTLSGNDIDNEDKLRFQMNLNLISRETAYRYATESGFYYIAEIALRNIILDDIKGRNYKDAQKNLSTYLSNHKKLIYPYFTKGNYLHLFYRYKAALTEDSLYDLSGEFNKAYQALLMDGEIIQAIDLLSFHCGSIIAKNSGTKQMLEDLIKKTNQLLPYGILYMLAGIYYNISNLAITLGEKEVALTYNEKCISATRLNCVNGIYDIDQMHELLALIYHQGAMASSNGIQSLKNELAALTEAKQVQDKLKRASLLGYINAGLCSLYMYQNFKKATVYGNEALEFGLNSHNKQIIARTYMYLAVADIMHGFRRRGILKFKQSYLLFKEIGESLSPFYDYINECQVSIDEIENL